MTEHKRISDLDEAAGPDVWLVGTQGDETVRIHADDIAKAARDQVLDRLPQPEPPPSITAPLVAVAVGAILGAQVLHFLLGLVGIAL